MDVSRNSLPKFLAACLRIAALAGTLAIGIRSGADVNYLQPRPTPLVFPTGGGVIGIAVADFNGDGKLDIAATQVTNVPSTGNRGFISIMLGKGDCTFNAPSSITLPTTTSIAYAYGILAKDFNGDGKIDLVVASFELGQVIFYPGLGDGTFGAPVFTATGGQPVCVQAGDVNGDGKLDLVVTNPSQFTISVLLGNGNGTFQAPSIHTMTSNASDLQIVDLNGDGKLDILAGMSDKYNVAVLLNNGSGQFPAASTEYDMRSQITGLTAADYLGTGNKDLALFGYTGIGQGVAIVPGLGNGVFATPNNSEFITGDWGYRSFSENIAPDFNFDGKPDLVFADHPDQGLNFVTVGLNTGGAFDFRSYVAGTGPVNNPLRSEANRLSGATWGDLNNDGALDLVVAANGGNYGGGGVFVLPGIPGLSGHFDAPRAFAATTQVLGARPIAMGDFDGDGIPDFAMLANAVCISRGNGDGTFTPTTWGVGHLSGPAEYYNSLRAADFNKDGKSDLVWNTGGGVHFATNVGGGSFNVVNIGNDATKNRGFNGRNIVVADFNNDTYPDFAVWMTDGVSCGIQLYLCGPGSTVVESTWIELGNMGGSPGGMLAADVNGDGKIDLVVHALGVGSAPDRLLMYAGNGNATFQAMKVIGSGWKLNPINEIRAADMNKDGKIDLIASDIWGGIYVMLGKGAGVFNAPIYAWSGSFINDIAVLDVDGDGYLDVAVAGVAGYCVLPGNGTGTLGDAMRFAVGSSDTWSIAPFDFDADGKVDVVVGHAQSGRSWNYLTMLKNTSVPAPTRAKAFTVSPASITGGAQTAKGTISLTRAAPAGGMTFTVTCDRPSWQVMFPATVTVPATKTSAVFDISTIYFSTQTTATFTVKGVGFTFVKTLTIKPIVPASLVLNPTTVTSGGTSTATVTLSYPAEPGDVTIALASSNTAAATVPSSVVVPHGATSATFPVTAKTVTAKKSASIKATLGGVTKSATLTVNP